MGIQSGIPSTRRGYLSHDELEQFANIVINDDTEADDVISQAEEIIDSYIRRADKFIDDPVFGIATGGTASTLIDTSGDSPFSPNDGYFYGCEVEIVKGTNQGERRRITDYDKSTQTITVANDFPSAIDSTSAYKIYQVGFFPRDNSKEVWHQNSTYYKSIPENVRRATAAQVEYIIEKGDAFFKGQTDFKSEEIDDYSYERDKGAIGSQALVAPKARMLLKGYVNRTGKLVAPNPTRT